MADIERIKKIPIAEAALRIGYTPVSVGSRYITLKEHDSVRIDRKTNLFYQNSTGASGSIIDFVMNFTNLSFQDTLKFLESEIAALLPKSEDRQYHTENEMIEFILPEADSSMKNVFAYLIKSRGIDGKVVELLVKNKQLYQDIHKNCVFVSYQDNKADFASIRGTNTVKRFVGDVAGSDYSHCFFIDNKSRELVITESVIDALSIMTLYKIRNEEFSNKNYLALSGTGKFEEPVKWQVKNADYKKIWLCFDNDNAGQLCNENIRMLLEKLSYSGNVISDYPKQGKDKNEELMIIKKSGGTP